MKINVKIILIGPHFYYDLISDYDDDFHKLFKIRADFDYEMNFNKENTDKIMGFIKKYINTSHCLDFDKKALIKLLELSQRAAERQNKLTANFSHITEIITEASTWATMDNKNIVSGEYVEKAINERNDRLNTYENKLGEMIDDNVVMIETSGSKVGQINGLAVIDLGDYAFAKPTRITATTYIGRAGIVNIEKEAKMSGAIHDKGVQIIIGYLGKTFAQDFPLSLSCRVCFEQNYSGIDGDSASSTELYAILSSLSNMPINQEIAVTGSINQHGEIQPIGGATYKIEGFYDTCKKQGFTGTQGVIIPKQNVPDLVLNNEVIEAVKNGVFHIYPISHVNEGIEILTNTPSGKLDGESKYPENSINAKVYNKLEKFYKNALLEK